MTRAQIYAEDGPGGAALVEFGARERDPIWETLVAASLGRANNAALAEAFSRVIDHGRLVSESMRMGLAPALIDALSATDLADELPPRTKTQLFECLWASEHTATVSTGYARALEAELSKADVRAVFTKGVVLSRLLYESRGVRKFSDIDLMCHPDDREPLKRILQDTGFVPDKIFDRETRTLRDRPRSELALFLLNPDHLPHFHKLTGMPSPPVIMLDVAMSLTWTSSVWAFSLEELFRSFDDVDGIRTLSGPVHFLFVVLHLFRDAWFYRADEELRLPQFADIVLFWRVLDSDDRKRVIELARAHSVVDPLVWVLHHVDSIYSTDISTSLQLNKPVSPSWAQSVRVDDGYRTGAWNMLERIQHRRLPELGQVAQPVEARRRQHVAP